MDNQSGSTFYGRCKLCGKNSELNDDGICQSCEATFKVSTAANQNGFSAQAAHASDSRSTKKWIIYIVLGIIAAALLMAQKIAGLLFITIAAFVLSILNFKKSKKVFTIFLAVSLLSLAVTFVVGQSPAGGSNMIQDNALTYIQKNYPDYSKATFEDNTVSVQDLDNDEHVVNAKILDNGGWEHDIKECIQLSPNGSQYIVCYLWIDGRNYVMNQPRTAPQDGSDNSASSKYYGNYAESATIEIAPEIKGKQE